MRRTELKRGTSQLDRGAPLKRTPMKRTAAREHKTKTTRRRMPTRTPAELAAIERDGPTCQRCLINVENVMASLHHRKSRRYSDADLVANLVVLCGSGTTGCHGFVTEHPKTAHDEGWVLWSRDDALATRCLVAPGATGRKPNPDLAPNLYAHMVMYLDDGTKEVHALVDVTGGGPIWTASR